MSPLTHPVEREQLMAYLDGELPADQAVQVAAHIAQCSECAATENEMQDLSQKVAAWEVGDSPDRMTQTVLSELRKKSGIAPVRKSRFASWLPQYGWAWAFGALPVVALLAAVTLFYVPNGTQRLMTSQTPPPALFEERSVSAGEANSGFGQQGQQGQQGQRSQQGQQSGSPGPMIIRTVRLSLISKEFENTRTRMDEILRQSRGYVDHLTIKADAGRARTLSVILRIPADQVDFSLNELKKLGRLLEESQNSTEVTGQYVDLVARLSNARNTEKRLLGLLSQRTGDLKDIVEMEREISQVREQIERMEASQKELDNKVGFASIQLEVTEEYKAQLEPASPSAGTRMRNALIEGYSSAVESTVSLALTLLRYGPTLLLWSLVVVPIVLAIRRLRLRPL